MADLFNDAALTAALFDDALSGFSHTTLHHNGLPTICVFLVTFDFMLVSM